MMSPTQGPGWLLAAGMLLLGLQEPASKPAAFDYSRVDRKIAGQPKYAAWPRYALLLLGSEKQTRIWMALDKSKAAGAAYDVLYIDRDADGILGEAGERVTGVADDEGGVDFSVGKLELPASKLVLEDFEISHRPPETIFMFKLNDKVKIYGVYGPAGVFFQFGDSPEKAPVLHVDPWGTWTFFLAGPDEMKIGQEENVMFYAGHRGSGPATFMALDEHFLDLDKDRIFVTLIAKDAQGKELRERAQLKEHC